VDHRIVDGAVLLGVFLEIVGLVCTVDWLREKVGGGLGFTGQAAYLLAFAYFGGHLNDLVCKHAWRRRFCKPPSFQHIFIGSSKHSSGCFFGIVFLVLDDYGWKVSAAIIGFNAARVVIALPFMVLLSLDIGALFDCSQLPNWLRLSLYDCSLLGWLRWRGVHFLFNFGFFATAGLGAWVAFLFAHAGDSITRKRWPVLASCAS
jgi:hypothetical protein